MSGAAAVTDADFDRVVLQADRPVLVDFWAQWCGPCRLVGPVLDAMAADLGDTLGIVKVDVDENPATTERYRVTSMPTLLLFKGGEVVHTIIGAKPRGMLEAELRPHLA
ncbi:MAG: thioredoxin [Microbacterium sp.]